ncbi:hypothetical protein BDY21DRAFT_361857 [Lineolata rhizophorae]|uniref:Uncharacterized protein n=1 Tax=Lineolata rhizophorae TaxID=578093 RepID=A0A6A6P7M0_9PEZI|nr:hypothetical protein BDY21DRAFT_361857 [Lineolata rhizophorae]
MSVMEPQSVQQQRPAEGRPRSKSGFSFKSEKSHTSGGSKNNKEHLRETHEEKLRRHFGKESKADPNAAMSEAQPMQAALERGTMSSLSSVQHLDMNGNPITEPDLSNPTRPRWERPLDTIRSFDARIDLEYKRRTTMFRADMGGYDSRRSSYYGDGYAPPMAGPSRNRFSQRLQSDTMINRVNGAGNNPPPPTRDMYASHGHQQSRDTVNTGASSGSQSEPWANSTDPSSENSSVDKINAAAKQPQPPPPPQPDLGEQYGLTGFGGMPQFQAPNLQENYGNNYSMRPPPPPNGGEYFPKSPNSTLPPLPQGMVPDARNKQPFGTPPQPLGASSGNAPAPARPNVLARDSTQSDKKRSWFKRRFSKNSD